MNLLSELLNNNGANNLDKAIDAVNKKFEPDEGEGKEEALIKILTSIIFTQIAEGSVRGFDVVRKKLFSHYYPIGYIAGFSVCYLQALGEKDREKQALIIRKVYDHLFSNNASDLFDKTFDPQNAENKTFIKGTDMGWRDAEENVSHDSKPEGLKRFLFEQLEVIVEILNMDTQI